MTSAPGLAALKLMQLIIATAGGRMAADMRHEARLADIRKQRGGTANRPRSWWPWSVSASNLARAPPMGTVDEA